MHPDIMRATIRDRSGRMRDEAGSRRRSGEARATRRGRNAEKAPARADSGKSGRSG